MSYRNYIIQSGVNTDCTRGEKMDYRISDIVNTAINNIGHIAEVNTIVGQPIIAPDGTTIMPVSQLTFAFMAGGGEYADKINKSIMKDDYIGHFTGGSGGGASRAVSNGRKMQKANDRPGEVGRGAPPIESRANFEKARPCRARPKLSGEAKLLRLACRQPGGLRPPAPRPAIINFTCIYSYRLQSNYIVYISRGQHTALTNTRNKDFP